MGEFRDHPQTARIGRTRILTEPDAIGQLCVTAGVDDAVEGGVPALGERIIGIFSRRLELFLNLDKCLSQLAYLLRTKRIHLFPPTTT